MRTVILAAFCGTGKTYLSQNSDRELIEFECWKYSDKLEFPHNIVRDIVSKYGKVDAILISTNPLVLNELIKKGLNVTIVCPDLSLKDEYIERYRRRGSSSDFIGTLSKYWESWLREAMAFKRCRQIVLKSGQYAALPILRRGKKPTGPGTLNQPEKV